MFSASHDTTIILQNTKLSGIIDISFSSSIDEGTEVLLSNRGINRRINKPQSIECKISKNYINQDIFQELTGRTDLSGQFVYGNEALDFENAAITNYSISISAQSSPKVSVTMMIYGNLSPTNNILTSTANEDYENKYLDNGAYSLIVDGKNSPISDFTYSVDFEIKPTFEIDTIKSSTLKFFPPEKHVSSAKMQMSEQEFEQMSGLALNPTFDRDISFSISDINQNILNTYSVPNAALSSQDISISAGDFIELSVSHQGYSVPSIV
jgi:hypothetical protein